MAQSDGVDTNKLHTEATQKILAGLFCFVLFCFGGGGGGGGDNSL